ncbi:uncharacterized protein LOC126802889 [Argentina anserina]|uniref:uncharacterized protein LOC126802889 n=1 Tax=Argentina anserina TaxID=57926 RepID=UPI0021762A1A|nr:uncharacterized protein LOC126802889 [Potentilla anserina]XP_050386555.1 uncharacterized protein LOC126802889 [Potentilla anserina]XP_050386556.1 uncharacterized protein LOC126802889 [Potentilla anserina]
MEDQCNPFSWDFCYEEEGMEDHLRHSLLYTTLELETTIASAKEKISRRDEEVVHLKDLLSRVIKERDEAKAICQRLVLEKLMLQQQPQKQQEQEVFAPQNHEDESKGSDSSRHYFAAAFSDSDENIISSPDAAEPVMSQDVLAQLLVDQKALPEKGKLLQAVIDAGPLLQTLLLAGSLPQWQHPPPQLKSTEIPPVTISPPTPQLLQHQDSCISTSSNTSFGSKRSLLVHSDGSGSNSDSSPKTKYQKIVLY